MAGHDGWKDQPRVPGGKSGGGQWTDSGGILLSERGQQDLRLFNTYAARWTGGIDANSRGVAYQQRFGVDFIREFVVPMNQIVPTGTGAGEVWVKNPKPPFGALKRDLNSFSCASVAGC